MDNAKVWVYSDPHWNHANIIAYSNRPFSSVFEMNEELVARWNRVVAQNDIVWHLGDHGFGKDAVEDRLNGRIRLIMGNHDFRVGKPSYWKKRRFEEVYDHPVIIYDRVILSHKPIPVDLGSFVNIHGHLHNSTTVRDMGLKHPEKYFNASCEMINYTPILLEDVLKALSR